MNAANKRREKDIMKLMVSDFEVVMSEAPSSSFASEFFVKFQGPKESPYEEVSKGGIESEIQRVIYAYSALSKSVNIILDK